MLRSTLSSFPLDDAVNVDTALPWGALITPLGPAPASPTAAGSDLEPTRAVTSVTAARTASEIPRCAECGGYIAEQCRVNVRSWRCALCHERNALPARYAPAVLSAHPAPHEAAPELAGPVYETPVDGPDAAALVPPTAYIFLVDATGDESFLDAVRPALAGALRLLAGDALVGVALFGARVSFLDIRGAPLLRRFHPDDDAEPAPAAVFPPEAWLRSLGDPSSAARIAGFLRELRPAAPAPAPARALGPAVDRALDAVDAGGLLAARLVVLAAGPPPLGAAAAGGAPPPPPPPPDRLPVAAAGAYAELGERAAALGAVVDVYMLCAGAARVATLAPLAQLSGGRLVRYLRGGAALARDVAQHLGEPAVVRGLLRLRTSPEYAVGDAYGCGVYRDVEVRDVYRLALHGAASTMAVEFAHSAAPGFAALRARAPALQLAFRAVRVEPGARPRRVLRVETRTYGVAADPKLARAAADPHAAAALVFHRALAAADEHDIAEARVLLFEWLAELLARAAPPGADADKIAGALDGIPALKAVPRIIFGFARSLLFRAGVVPEDERAARRCDWEDLGAEWLAAAAYPRLSAFRSLDQKAERQVPLSMQAVRDSGCPVFLLDAFDTVIVFYTAEERRDVPFPPPDDCAVMKIQKACLANRPLTPTAIVCRQGEKDEHLFKSFLIDEPPKGKALSYAAFIAQVADAASDLVDSSPSAQ